jgi:hypothetical protein
VRRKGRPRSEQKPENNEHMLDSAHENLDETNDGFYAGRVNMP